MRKQNLSKGLKELLYITFAKRERRIEKIVV